MNEYFDAQTWAYYAKLQDLIAEKAISHGSFTFSSGVVMNRYCDMRLVSCDPYGANLMGKIVAKIASFMQIDFMGGPATGAIPITSAAMAILLHDYERSIPTFYSREEPKRYGKLNRVEGAIIPPNSKVMLLEDTMSTGSSLLSCADAVRELSCDIVHILAIAHYPSLGGLSRLQNLGYSCTALYSVEDF